jgi:hypothetical protein
MAIPINIKEASKVVGYFSYTNSGVVFCDGDACVIAGSEELMKSYLLKIPTGDSRDIIKKTRFGEIINGMKQGGAYAFDKESYDKFLFLAKLNEIDGLPSNSGFLDKPEEELNFIRIQLTEF